MDLRTCPWIVLGALAAGMPAGAESRVYVVDAAASSVAIQVGRAGLFGFVGHEHQVLATSVEGEVIADPGDLGRSTVTLEFASAALTVSAKGETADDVPKVQARMAGPEVLDVARFASIAFRSTSVEGRLASDGSYNLRIVGTLRIRGISRPLTVPLRVQVVNGTLTASGQAVVKQTDFGIAPVSVGGVVKVRNELGVDYKIVAHAAP